MKLLTYFSVWWFESFYGLQQIISCKYRWVEEIKVLVLVINFVTLNLHKIKKNKKNTENTAKQYTAEQEPKDLRGSAMCLHPRENAAHHHHIDHEITSSIQAAASFDLSWFLFQQNLSQSPSSLSLLNSLFFCSNFDFASLFSATLKTITYYITWSRVYIHSRS